MYTKRVAAALLAVALLGVSGLSAAAGKPQSGMPAHGGAMGSEMMRNCPMMGQLPPGNEKLAMQMHGEMMKAMGDIMLKYADKIQTPPAK
jgi:hypothetical protein